MGIPRPVRRRTESYVPDAGDNRVLAETGGPALIATLQRPDVRLWGDYLTRRRDRLLARGALPEVAAAAPVDDAPGKPAPAPQLTADEAYEVDGFLFSACVRRLFIGMRGPAGWEEIEPYRMDDGTLLDTGAALWALKGELDFADGISGLFADLEGAIFDRATFDAGTLATFPSRSGPPVSEAPTAGTAETVGAAA